MAAIRGMLAVNLKNYRLPPCREDLSAIPVECLEIIFVFVE
jgi:hypothetical protein